MDLLQTYYVFSSLRFQTPSSGPATVEVKGGSLVTQGAGLTKSHTASVSTTTETQLLGYLCREYIWAGMGSHCTQGPIWQHRWKTLGLVLI